MSAPASVPTGPPTPQPGGGDFRLPLRVRLGMFVRLLAIQGAWNYETLLGNGMAFAMEPALRRLPEGRGGPAYRAAMARQSRYFNAHPYLAGVAVGALARAELEGEAPARIERFRTAVCGPLGSCGDRLVWAAWLPLCSLVAIGAWGVGGGPLLVVALFLLLYNAGHFALRAWGLRVGLAGGLKVAGALGSPWLRQGPEWLGQGAAFLAGIVIPLAVARVLGGGGWPLGALLGAVLVGAVLFVRLQGRWEGWRVALPLLVLLVLFSVAA